MSLEDFFNGMENTCVPIAVGDESTNGMSIPGTAYFAWSKKGIGFGQLYFS